MNTAFPDNAPDAFNPRRHSQCGTPTDVPSILTHAPFRPEIHGHFRPWLATLASSGIPYIVDDSGDSPVIWVPWPFEDAARTELDAYEETNVNWPRHSQNHDNQIQTPLFNDVGICVFLLVEAALYRFFLFVEQSMQKTAWKNDGLWDYTLVTEHAQWWRNITALTLHADAAHVLSNMLWGFIFGSLASARIGTGFTLLLMLASGALGNASMAFLGEAPHQSLGASTMVFGMLGILTALHTLVTWKHREEGRGLIRLIPWVPLAFGIAMALLTGGAPGSDALAHACGFTWGLILGVAVTFCPTLLNSLPAQIAAGVIAVLLTVLAWAVP